MNSQRWEVFPYSSDSGEGFFVFDTWRKFTVLSWVSKQEAEVLRDYLESL